MLWLIYFLSCLLIAVTINVDGMGPLLWSPLSEIPAVGRNGLYIGTLFISVLLMIPAALTNNLAGLFVLKLFIGFFSTLLTVLYQDLFNVE